MILLPSFEFSNLNRLIYIYHKTKNHTILKYMHMIEGRSIFFSWTINCPAKTSDRPLSAKATGPLFPFFLLKIFLNNNLQYSHDMYCGMGLIKIKTQFPYVLHFTSIYIYIYINQSSANPNSCFIKKIK